MGRPRSAVDKIQTTVYIDLMRHHQAKEAGLNFSQLLIEAIDNALGNNLTAEAMKTRLAKIETSAVHT